MPKKEEQKKNWREKRRRALEEYERNRAREPHAKRRKYPQGRIIFGICLIALIFAAYVAWQSTAKSPSSTTGTTNKPPSTGLAPGFSLNDINGTPFSLTQQSGKVIAVHFMAVSCGGGIVETNENQLRTLKNMCSTYCGQKSVSIVTVAATTCATSCLEIIRSDYAVTWTLGNDYDDGKMDIVNAYSSYSITDGAIVLIDRNFKIDKVYTGETTFETLSSRISQLL